jgi:hypothetical protein
MNDDDTDDDLRALPYCRGLPGSISWDQGRYCSDLPLATFPAAAAKIIWS